MIHHQKAWEALYNVCAIAAQDDPCWALVDDNSLLLMRAQRLWSAEPEASGTVPAMGQGSLDGLPMINVPQYAHNVLQLVIYNVLTHTKARDGPSQHVYLANILISVPAAGGPICQRL
jgi:hypothetical protein